jgi:putative spermidine/putrescine transport system ATP-binding protein
VDGALEQGDRTPLKGGAVELVAVSKSYPPGAVPVVRDLSLSVATGESVALLGPSGCGKTTTLNMVAGFTDPDRGTILIDGVSMDGTPPHRRDTAMVFQSYALFPHLSVFDNVGFGLVMRRTPRTEIGRRVGEALALVRLQGLDARYPRELSGGQQQRVALARALVVKPAVLLLDEPLSNLDARLRQEMRIEIAEIQDRLGITTIFVTHDQEEALTIADRVAVMREGTIEQVGSPERVYDQPETEFVARFIGDANFLAGRVVSTDGDLVTVECAEGLRVAAPRAAWTAAGTPVTVMVRPEKVRIDAAASSAGAGVENRVTAVVRAVSFLGPVTRLDATVAGASFTVALHDAGDLGDCHPGGTVGLRWRATDSRLIGASA